MKSIKDSIRKKDIFGHFIQLNFDGSEGLQYHKTFVGGTSTILVLTFLAFITLINVEKWYFNLDDKNTT